MTPASTEVARPGLIAQFRAAAVLTWHELPRVAPAGAIWLLSLGPVLVAVRSGSWWLIAVSTIPAVLLTTGMARFAVAVQRGGRARIRDVFAVDPVLSFSIVVIGCLAERLMAAGEVVAVPGFALAATLLVVGPAAVAYGAVRHRSGFAAIRGGVILAGYRPAAAITLLALCCLGAFAVIGSFGALAVFVPGLLAVFGAAVVADLLDAIDKGSGRSS